MYSEASIVAGLLTTKRQNNLILVFSNESEFFAIADVIKFYQPERNVLFFPGWDIAPYRKVHPSQNAMAQRIKCLYQIINSKKQYIIVTTVPALVQKVPPRQVIEHSRCIIENSTYKEIIEYLSEHGYNRSPLANDPGEFSIRGSIIDIFPVTERAPIRIDFFCNRIESICNFDPISQISDKTALANSTIFPASELIKKPEYIENFRKNYLNIAGNSDEVLFSSIISGQKHLGEENFLPLFYNFKMSSLFDYVSDYQIFSSGIPQICKFYEEIQSNFIHANFKQVPPQEMYVAQQEISPLAQITHQGHPVINMQARPKTTNIFDYLMGYINSLKPKQCLFACYSEGSLSYIKDSLKERNITPIHIKNFSELQQNRQDSIAILPIKEGFQVGSLLVITEHDLLGDRLTTTRRKNQSSILIDDLNPGDLVVHQDYGIGIFSGLKTLNIMAGYHDFLQLLYYNNDKLFVPVENINLVTKYSSNAQEKTELDKLGSLSWQERKARLKKKIQDIAQELLIIEAQRKLSEGEVFSKNDAYKAFCAEFPYIETEDQLNAIIDVENDLARGQIMDRLICGDVGFGKTEVALRAAFLVAGTDVQVAIISPTTLLCRQHFAVFTDRFKNFPNIKIKQLSRAVSAKDAKKVKEELEYGIISIIIGTHALLADSTKFYNLALLIIDEEQLFGVKQKEKLKALKHDVHVLMLSATPIPRTLHMSISGMKDISLINTPPIDRLPIKTSVIEYDPEIIKEAIIREYNRDGRVFYVCPLISDMANIAKQLQQLLPEIKVGLAHGQLSSTVLDQTMNDFYDGKFTILLTTSIIECGIDIPMANTIIVHNAEFFGLAQLYQLQGRVGRSKTRGYSYFVASLKCSTNSLQRLGTMNNIKSGFSISLYDMDVRGFGNLVGEKQSGHVKEIGIELYQQMLEEEIDRSKKKRHCSNNNIKINLDLNVRIPESYIEDLNLRMRIYKQIAKLQNNQEIEDFIIEIINRFGPIPDEVHNLIGVIRIKQSCNTLGVEELTVSQNIATLKVSNNVVFSEGLLGYIMGNPIMFKLKNTSTLTIIMTSSDALNVIPYLNEMSKYV